MHPLNFATNAFAFECVRIQYQRLELHFKEAAIQVALRYLVTSDATDTRLSGKNGQTTFVR